MDTEGDAFFVVFEQPADALAAAAAAQEALASGPVRVRMGVHTGEVLLTETGYVGGELHRAARIAAPPTAKGNRAAQDGDAQSAHRAYAESARFSSASAAFLVAAGRLVDVLRNRCVASAVAAKQRALCRFQRVSAETGGGLPHRDGLEDVLIRPGRTHSRDLPRVGTVSPTGPSDEAGLRDRAFGLMRLDVARRRVVRVRSGLDDHAGVGRRVCACSRRFADEAVLRLVVIVVVADARRKLDDLGRRRAVPRRAGAVRPGVVLGSALDRDAARVDPERTQICLDLRNAEQVDGLDRRERANVRQRRIGCRLEHSCCRALGITARTASATRIATGSANRTRSVLRFRTFTGACGPGFQSRSRRNRIAFVALGKNAKIELLKRVPLFAGCSNAELREIALSADELDLRDGYVLTREGKPGREFFVLIEGTARVTKKDKKIADLSGGDWFGEIALLTHTPRTATVTATSPVRVLVVTDRAFRRVVETMPRIALKVLASVGQRLEHDARS